MDKLKKVQKILWINPMKFKKPEDLVQINSKMIHSYIKPKTVVITPAAKIHLENLDEQIDDLKHDALANYEIESKPWLYADEEEEEDNEDDDDSPMMANMVPSYDPNVTQFALINKLEKKLRALLKAVLKQQDNWYENYIPNQIKFGLEILENTKLGYSYSHISNNDWGERNPGTDNQQITFSKNF